MNDIIEVRALMYAPTGLQTIIKINKDLYMVKDTGEVKEYQHHENRGQNIGGLKRSFGKLRKLINNNFCGKPNELFITLTYAQNMKDHKQLYEDFKNFMKRIKYSYPAVDYIMVPEPQQRGAWHCHVLLRFNDRETVYIPNGEIAALWGHGYTTTKALRGVDNIGAYLSAYLTDMEFTKETAPLAMGCEVREIDLKDAQGNMQTKRFIKGARCQLYPPGMNICRSSRGCRPPESDQMEYSQVEKIVGTSTPDYGCSVTLTADDGRLLNTITYQHFNLKRSKKQGGEKNNDN